MNQLKEIQNELFEQVAEIIISARKSVVRNTNTVMANTYFLVGMRIVEHEQQGEARAKYAKNILTTLSQQLKKQFGKGFSVDNLENMRKFYLTYSISENRSRKLQSIDNKLFDIPVFTLSWSHYLILCRIKNEEERRFYEIEAIQNDWNLEELQRQFDAALYERLVLSTDKAKIVELSKKGQIIKQPKDLIKDPLILEFLGLEEKTDYSETDRNGEPLRKSYNQPNRKVYARIGQRFFHRRSPSKVYLR
jgi:hypothetical protein